MRVWKVITLGFWVMLMTACVSLIAVYYILAQTVLNPTTVKKWLDESGSYTTLAETIVPMLATGEDATAPSNKLVTPEMLKRAAKASITPNDVKAKVEPVIDATYAWLDSKSPEVTFSVSVGTESERFLQALRREVRSKLETLPECGGTIDIRELEQASCLPWFVSAESATDSVMTRIEQRDIFRDKEITPDSLSTSNPASASNRLPEIVSLLWVVQLIAMPVAGVVALFVIAKRRATGLIAVGISLLLPGIALLIVGLLSYSSGAAIVSGFVEKSEFATIAAPLGTTVAKSLASVTLQISALLCGVAVVIGALGIWWRKRIRKSK